MGERGKCFLTEELQLKNRGEMIETENQHLANTTVITASGRNHQGMSKWVGKVWGETGYSLVPKYPPMRYLLITKRKMVASQQRKLASTTLSKWAKLPSPVMGHTHMMCLLIWRTQRDTTSSVWHTCPQCIIWIESRANIRQTETEGTVENNLSIFCEVSRSWETNKRLRTYSR